MSEWEVYDRIEPIGQWYLMSYMASIITNLTISVYGKSGAKFTAPMDFLPPMMREDFEEKKEQTIDDMKNILTSIAKMQNKGQKKLKRQTGKK